MPTETIIANFQELEIESAPITLIFHRHDIYDIETPRRIMIDPEASIYHADRVQKLHSKTLDLFKKVFPDYEDIHGFVFGYKQSLHRPSCRVLPAQNADS